MKGAVSLFDWADRNSANVGRADVLAQPAKIRLVLKLLSRDWCRLGIRVAAIWLALVSAYFSVVGMTAIFAGAFWPVVIMAAGLEWAKLVTASWLRRGAECHWLLKTTLVAFIFVLIAMTCMAVFGFLSKSHIDHQLGVQTGAREQLTVVDRQIADLKDEIADIDREKDQIDTSVEKLNQRGRSETAMKMAAEQRRRRAELSASRRAASDKLVQLYSERALIEVRLKRGAAEVGPIRYLAQLIGGHDVDLEKAVQRLILVITFVLDPLAVLLWSEATAARSKAVSLSSVVPQIAQTKPGATLPPGQGPQRTPPRKGRAGA